MATNTQLSNPIVADDFLLYNGAARELYHDYAVSMPIIDYHCHLPPDQLASDHRFENLTDVWLRGDHYKWRAMRANGIPESGITGSADDREKHRNWAATLPYTMRNPLYHWSHLELDRYFGVSDLLGPENADQVYDRCTERLRSDAGLSVRGMVRQMNVKVICTTDDPADSLEHHQRLGEEDWGTKVYPSFRPDKSTMIRRDDYNEYIDRLSKTADKQIDSYRDLIETLHTRIDFFHSLGCRVSDHGLNQLFAVNYTEADLEKAFAARRAGKAVSPELGRKFQMGLLVELSRRYHALGWTQQFHLGALRDNNERILRNLGADAGVDSIGDFSQARGMAFLFNTLDNSDQLAKTIVYNLNPADNEVFATMVGNFNDGSVVGKMQYGSGWWFLDQLDGMEKQMNVLSNMGLISRFVGMLTDSRSFLSFPRHEYFRRLLCNMFGQDIERGLLPDDRKWIGKLVQDISYNNANQYFNFP